MRLRENGIDAEPGSNLKDIAKRYDRMPVDIVEIIKTEIQLKKNKM